MYVPSQNLISDQLAKPVSVVFVIAAHDTAFGCASSSEFSAKTKRLKQRKELDISETKAFCLYRDTIKKQPLASDSVDKFPLSQSFPYWLSDLQNSHNYLTKIDVLTRI